MYPVKISRVGSSRHFGEIGPEMFPEMLPTCSIFACRPVTGRYVVCLLPPDIWSGYVSGFSGLKLSEIPGEIQKKKSSTDRQGFIEHMRKKQDLTPKSVLNTSVFVRKKYELCGVASELLTVVSVYNQLFRV